jgi:hypothetical protein
MLRHMLQRKLCTEVRVYGGDKYKFIPSGSPSKKRLKFIMKIHMGSTGQYKQVATLSTIKDFFNFHRVMLKSKKKHYVICFKEN